MNIYYVNKNAKFNGPFDAQDSHHKRFMNIGDVCLLERENDLIFLYIVSEINSWKSCKFLGNTTEKIHLEGNTMLFAFDGRTCRKGNLILLRQLISVIKDALLLRLIQNAIDILSYKEDLWDLSLIVDMYQQVIVEPESALGSSQVTPTQIKRFVDYFDDEVRRIYVELSQSDMTARNVFLSIRNKFPQQFRKAMKAFLADNPNSSIYD